MKKYLVKDKLTDLERAQLNVVLSDIAFFIADRRDFLVSLGILSEVEI